jgi:hypothetical protein
MGGLRKGGLWLGLTDGRPFFLDKNWVFVFLSD